MRIIKFKQGYYSPNVALVVKLDAYKQSQLLTPTGLQTLSVQPWNAYWSAVQANAQLELMNDKTADFKLYTVDLQAYSDLYVKVADKTYKVFAGYADILEHMLAYDMTNCMQGQNQVQLSLLTGNYGELVQPKLDSKQSIAMYCQGSGTTSSRLINIAILSDEEPEFFRQLTTFNLNKEDDSLVESIKYIDVIEYTAATYDTTDYNFVKTAVGQRFKLRKLSNLQLSVRVTAFDESKVLIASGGIEQLNALQDIVDIREDAEWLTVQFMYNDNRQYAMTCNTSIVEIPSIPVNSIKIISSDMLEHAKACGIVQHDNVIRMSIKQFTYRLSEVTKHTRMQRINLMQWHTDDYVYKTFDNNTTANAFTSKNTGCWLCSTYKLQKLQTSDAKVRELAVNIAKLSTRFGNAEHSLLVETMNIRVPESMLFNDGRISYQAWTSTLLNNYLTLETQVNICLQYRDLPYIIDGKVDFNGIRYTFNDNRYSNKQFATVIVPVSSQSQNKTYRLIETSLYIVLVAYMYVESFYITYLPDYWYSMHDFDILPAVAFANNGFCHVEVMPHDYALDLPVDFVLPLRIDTLPISLSK